MPLFHCAKKCLAALIFLTAFCLAFSQALASKTQGQNVAEDAADHSRSSYEELSARSRNKNVKPMILRAVSLAALGLILLNISSSPIWERRQPRVAQKAKRTELSLKNRLGRENI